MAAKRRIPLTQSVGGKSSFDGVSQPGAGSQRFPLRLMRHRVRAGGQRSTQKGAVAGHGFGGGVKKILSQLPELTLRIYKLTAARERVHRNQAHPQKDGHAVSLDDLALTAEFEWSSTLVLGYVNR